MLTHASGRLRLADFVQTNSKTSRECVPACAENTTSLGSSSQVIYATEPLARRDAARFERGGRTAPLTWPRMVRPSAAEFCGERLLRSRRRASRQWHHPRRRTLNRTKTCRIRASVETASSQRQPRACPQGPHQWRLTLHSALFEMSTLHRLCHLREVVDVAVRRALASSQPPIEIDTIRCRLDDEYDIN
jgi:hypothetical protein